MAGLCARSVVAAFVLVVFASAIIDVVPGASAIDCSDVLNYLMPCAMYMQGDGSGSVPSDCCDGIQSLSDATSTTRDKRQACTCIKSYASAGASSVNPALVKNLISSCGVQLSFVPSAKTNCNSIS